MICVFFGHHDCPDSIRDRLSDAIRKEIETGSTLFFVGTHGSFDSIALSCLREIKKDYPEIRYAVVLAYLPNGSSPYSPEETVVPEGIETVPKRFAIDYRNRWMIDRADTVISYVTHSSGKAAYYVEKARKKGIKIIRL